MKFNSLFVRFVILLVIMGAVGASAWADEGMWLFNALPKKHLKAAHDFEPTEAWSKHVMLSSVRFNSGGSASFVSSTGLVLTNHHVGADTLHKVSTAENNYYRDGFYATSWDQEIAAADLELNQLVSIENVTQRVSSSVKPGMAPGEAFAARRAVTSAIEKESLDSTGLRSDVVMLYGGARYHLYRYKKYTDVRLVWAPEAGIAFFGGDADNFEYPRFCLDVCIFRVYENGKPARTHNFLRMSKNGAADGELVFVSGNPGRTQRIFTTAALKYQRDHYLPYVLSFLHRREILFQQFGFGGDEQKRRAKDELFGLQNSRKALTGMNQGLQDPSFMAQKESTENALRRQVESNANLKKYANAWKAIEEVQAKKVDMLGQTGGLAGQVYSIASILVTMAAEDLKPNGERLGGFSDAGRQSLEMQLFSPAPIYPDLELTKFADSISLFVERRGGDHPLVQQVLANRSPQAAAAELLAGSKLMDVAERKKLAKGGQAAINASTDTMIQLARMLDTESRRLIKIGEEVGETERQAYSQIADAMFAVQGTDSYPDATFTLRLAFGPVKGYQEGSKWVPPMTTIGGAFEHEENHGSTDPWELPKRWHDRKGNLNLKTPFNFVCTADIIGGNSGSPVINRNAELVGVIFDGNIQSLTSDYFYSDKVGRAVSVHSSAMLEALRNVYDAGKLAEELGR
jgi:hypothetical protein